MLAAALGGAVPADVLVALPCGAVLAAALGGAIRDAVLTGCCVHRCVCAEQYSLSSANRFGIQLRNPTAASTIKFEFQPETGHNATAADFSLEVDRCEADHSVSIIEPQSEWGWDGTSVL